MRIGYAIMDGHGWLQTRTRVDGVSCPVTVYVEEEEHAMIFRRLKDAKSMLKAVRKDHRRPDRVHIISARGRVIV